MIAAQLARKDGVANNAPTDRMAIFATDFPHQPRAGLVLDAQSLCSGNVFLPQRFASGT